MQIIDTKAIQAAYAKFKPSPHGAHATCRCLPGHWQQENCQEWAECGTMHGAPATVFYMFENSEVDVEDGADIPFDLDHITHIEIEE